MYQYVIEKVTTDTRVTNLEIQAGIEREVEK